MFRASCTQRSAHGHVPQAPLHGFLNDDTLRCRPSSLVLLADHNCALLLGAPDTSLLPVACSPRKSRLPALASCLTVSTSAAGKCVVLKTSTRQTIFLPVVGLVDPASLKPNDLVGVNKDSYLVLDTLPAEYDSRVKAMEVRVLDLHTWPHLRCIDTGTACSDCAWHTLCSYEDSGKC